MGQDRIKDQGWLPSSATTASSTRSPLTACGNTSLTRFDEIYILDLGGNVRKNPKLSGTTHNVFGIQVGVAITLLVKKAEHDITKQGEILYATVGEDWKKEQKYGQLNDWEDLHGVPWKRITPDARNTWLRKGMKAEYEHSCPLRTARPSPYSPTTH